MVSRLYTEKFLDDSRMLANEILFPHSKNDSLGTTIHHHHSHTHWGSPLFGGWGYYPQPVYIPTSHRAKRENEDNRWLAIPVAIAALAMLFPAAKNWAEWTRAERGIADLQEKIQNVGAEIKHSPRDVHNAIHDVFHQQTALFNRIRTDARNGFFIKGVLIASLVGGTLSLAGLITSATFPILCGAGAVTSIGAMIWRYGIRSIDNEVQTKAKELSAATERASRILFVHYVAGNIDG